MLERDYLNWLRRVDPAGAEKLDRAYDESIGGQRLDMPTVRARARRIARTNRRVPRPANTIRGVTITSAAGLAALHGGGVLSPLPEHVESDHRAAYDWMRWRMLHRVTNYSGRFPIWFWLADAGTWRGPLGVAERGDVLLIVDLPAHSVLLSDFGDWHSVLNGWTPTPTICPVCARVLCYEEQHELEPDAWDRLYKGSTFTPGDWSEFDPESVRQITPLWEQIFDADRHAVATIQGTTEFVLADQVVAVFVK